MISDEGGQYSNKQVRVLQGCLRSAQSISFDGWQQEYGP